MEQALCLTIRSPQPRTACRNVAFIMQMVGDMLLARAVLSEYQYAHVGWCYQPYPVHDFPEGGTVTGKHGHTAPPDIPLFQYGTEKRHEFVLHECLGM